MEFAQLEDEVKEMNESQKKVFHEIIALSSLGGEILPSMKEHLEKANSLHEFLDLMYMDDNCRYEKAWALWAKHSNKNWYTRFKPERVCEGALLERGGVVLESEKNMMLIPVRGTRARDRTIDLFVFPDDGFNTDLGEYYGSISGSFVCYELPLEGTFDIYRTGRALVFERWAFDKLGYRKEKASRKGACRCSL